MKLKGPKEKTINGVECVCRELAADALQISVSTLDKIVAKTKSGKASVAIKFIQFTKGSQLWFPKEGLKEFVNELMVSGGSAI